MTTPIPLPLLMTDEARRRAELREFLTSRRARITPDQVGMPAGGGRRRTPGLRREEVAVLAGVGVSWYQWLEQGRDITVSGQVLDSVGRVLKLSEPELQHLYALAGLTPPALRLSPPPGACGSPLIRLIEAWQPNPAHIVDRYWNIRAMNSSAHLVFGYDQIGVNCLEDFFTNAGHRSAYPNLAEITRRVVAQFRAEMTNHPGDAGYVGILERLRARSPEFGAVWDLHEVQAPGTNLKVFRHAEAGELHFESTQLRVPEWPDLMLILHTPLVETDTRARLEKLVATHERRHYCEDECCELIA
ncbi:MAG TPA: helix-turn-helix transcriptional regulator [Actinocrinis sp.]|nr:helix-turn-helix transcriptional regulator [Actinocrinis sp.]